MSARKQITVHRSYKPDPDYCAEALELLLRTPVHKEGGPPTAPDDVKESNGYVARKNSNAS